MPGFKESSILFSLQGLMDREKDRLDQEQSDQLRAIEQTNQVRLERERRHHEAEERRTREAQERESRDDAQRREHQARLDAMKRAEIERVRLEAESRSRLEVIAMEQEHERRMAAIEIESRVRRFRAFAVGGVALGIATLVCASALYLGKLRPEQARMEGAYAQLVTAQQARADDAERLAERQTHKTDEVTADLGDVKRKLADARREIGELQQLGERRSSGARVAAPPIAPAHDKNCGDPNDPLNGCLK